MPDENHKRNEAALKQILYALLLSKEHMVDKKPSEDVIDFLSDAQNTPPDYIKSKYKEIYDAYYHADSPITFADLILPNPNNQ